MCGLMVHFNIIVKGKVLSFVNSWLDVRLSNPNFSSVNSQTSCADGLQLIEWTLFLLFFKHGLIHREQVICGDKRTTSSLSPLEALWFLTFLVPHIWHFNKLFPKCFVMTSFFIEHHLKPELVPSKSNSETLFIKFLALILCHL